MKRAVLHIYVSGRASHAWVSTYIVAVSTQHAALCVRHLAELAVCMSLRVAFAPPLKMCSAKYIRHAAWPSIRHAAWPSIRHAAWPCKYQTRGVAKYQARSTAKYQTRGVTWLLNEVGCECMHDSTSPIHSLASWGCGTCAHCY